MEKQIGKRRRSPAPEREKAPRAEDVKIDGKIKNERKKFSGKREFGRSRDVRENHGLEISAKARRRFADTFFCEP